MTDEKKIETKAPAAAATTTDRPTTPRPTTPSRPSAPRPSGSRPGGGGGRPGGSRPPFRGRPGGRDGGRGRGGFFKKKGCRYCKNTDIPINYKDARALRPFLTEKGKIMPRRITGNCAKHQRVVTMAIKRARNIAILPYTTISL